jgi:hypothetical protein
MKKYTHFFSKAVQPLLLFGLAATLCFAQASPFGQVAQGVSVEVVAIVKWVGIIIAVVVGLSMAGGGSHGANMGAKITGLLIGLTLALFASPIVNWVQSL